MGIPLTVGLAAYAERIHRRLFGPQNLQDLRNATGEKRSFDLESSLWFYA
jgi:hypothetical protein